MSETYCNNVPFTMAEVRVVFARYALDEIGKKGGTTNY
jgi:hypothetical protein